MTSSLHHAATLLSCKSRRSPYVLEGCRIVMAPNEYLSDNPRSGLEFIPLLLEIWNQGNKRTFHGSVSPGVGLRDPTDASCTIALYIKAYYINKYISIPFLAISLIWDFWFLCRLPLRMVVCLPSYAFFLHAIEKTNTRDPSLSIHLARAN